MTNSILDFVKEFNGVLDEDKDFDNDIIADINTAFMILWQLGVGPKTPFNIKDSTATWEDFIDDNIYIDSVKTYVGLKVRMMFDPPSSSTHADAINRNIAEMEWRLQVASEHKQKEEG